MPRKFSCTLCDNIDKLVNDNIVIDKFVMSFYMSQWTILTHAIERNRI